MTDEVERIKLAGQIDISCVQAFHTLKEIDEMIEIAKKYGFAAVFTLPAFSAHVAERLRDCKEIHTGGVVSFPGGGDTIEPVSYTHLENPSCGHSRVWRQSGKQRWKN